MNKTNGSGMNGSGPHGPDDDDEDENIVHFPTLADRDRMRKEKTAKEETWRKDYKAKQKALKPKFINLDKIPPFARILMAAMVLIHIILHIFIGSIDRAGIIYTLGFVPGKWIGAADIVFEPITLLTPLTYMFLHGDWFHLIFNSLMALAMGVFFERIFGSKATAKFFILCGLGGAALYFIVNPYTLGPVIGASGAISGLFAALIIVLYHEGRFGQMSSKGPWPILIFWLLLMLAFGLMGGNTAWEAHLGGYLTGIALITAMRKGKIRL